MFFEELTLVWHKDRGQVGKRAGSDVQGTHRAKTKIDFVAAFESARNGAMPHEAVQYL